MATKTWPAPRVHWWLTAIWVSLASVIVAELLCLSIFSAYVADSDTLWRWYVPRVAPFLTVTLSVWHLRIRGLLVPRPTVERTRACVACGGSVAYLTLLLLPPLVHPFSPFSLPVLLQRISLPMDFFQIVVGVILSVFFMSEGKN